MQRLSDDRPFSARPLGVFITFLVLFIAASILSVLVIAPLVKRAVSPFFSEAIVECIKSYFGYTIGIHIVFLLYILCSNRGVLSRFFAGYRNNTVLYFVVGVLSGTLFNAVCIAVPFFRGDLSFAPGNLPLPTALLLFFCVFVQSSAEELSLRGYFLYYMADSSHRPWFAILFSAVLFAACHLANPGITVLSVVNLILVGVFLAIFVWFFGSYWFAMAFHTGWNYCQAFLFGLPNSGIAPDCSLLQLSGSRQSMFYDTSFGVESTVTATAVYTLMILAELLVIKFRKNRNTMNTEAIV